MKNSLTTKVCVLLAVLLGLALPRHGWAQTAIIEKGEPRATIFFEAQAGGAVRLAAIELQSHLRLVTGATVPITSDSAQLQGYVIYLGNNAFAAKNGVHAWQLPPDGYRILSGKNWLIIAGKDYAGPPLTGFENPWRYHETFNTRLQIGAFGNAGTLFGVYHFLERYGVRWYMPGSLGTVIPRTDTITVPALNISKAPYYEHRHAYYGFMDRSESDAIWYRQAGYGSPAPVQVTHSFGHFFNKYKDTHPEYFALIDGKRDFTNLSSAEETGNLNLSDPGLLQAAIAEAGAYFDENPGQTIFPLGPPDGWTKMSEDPLSQAQLDKSRGHAGEFSNYFWGFINKVARGIREKYPDKFIGALAYERYAAPPTNIERLEPNVVVVMTKKRAWSPDPNVKGPSDERIAVWKKKVNTIYTWEYYCNSFFNPDWRGYPMFFTSIVQNDLKSLKGVVKGEFIEAESWLPEQYATAPGQIRVGYPGLQHPLLYITARLLWDPDLDLTALVDEYYRLFYGPAEKPMRNFWSLVDSNWNKKGWHMTPGEVYDRETIDKLVKSLDEARAAAGPDSIYRQRIDLIRSEFTPTGQAEPARPAVNK